MVRPIRPIRPIRQAQGRQAQGRQAQGKQAHHKVTKKVITGNYAAAEGVRLCRPKVIAAYPITPQTSIAEKLAEFCANGELKAEYIPVESEHSSMSVCIGAAVTGVRTFTATSSQGLLLMHEMLPWAAGTRLPIVMVNTNRAIGAPIMLWTDQNDSLSQRDTGWLQFYCESAQEVLDTVIQAYRIAEQILLPVMVISEGFILSHTAEPVDIPEQELVDAYLPPYQAQYKLDIEDPRAIGALAWPDEFTAMKIQMQEAMEKAKETSRKADEEFKQMFGRSYGLIEKCHWENPEIVLVTAGTITSTARETLNGLSNPRIGLLKMRIFRPFPTEEIREAFQGVKKVAVIDRNLSAGMGGIFSQEIKAAMYGIKHQPEIFSFIAGLGGKDITPETIERIINYTLENSEAQENIVWAR